MYKILNMHLRRFIFSKTIIAILSFILLISSCTKEVVPVCSPILCPTEVSYSTEIKPLISAHCATNLGPGTGCHDAWIFDYNEVIASIKSGAFETVIENKTMPKLPNTFGITA